VQVITWQDLSPKWSIVLRGTLNSTHSLSHLLIGYPILMYLPLMTYGSVQMCFEWVSDNVAAAAVVDNVAAAAVIAGQQIVSADHSVISTSCWVEVVCSDVGECSQRSWRTAWSLGFLPESGTFHLLTITSVSFSHYDFYDSIHVGKLVHQLKKETDCQSLSFVSITLACL